MKHSRRTRILRIKTDAQAPMNEYGFDVARFIEHIINYKHEVLDAVFTAKPEPEIVPQEQGFIKAKYRHEMVEAISYQFLVPDKPAYMIVCNLIMDAFMTKEGVADMPAVKAYLEMYPEEQDALVEVLMAIVTGSSRFDVDGRYYGLDEKTQVVQVFVTDPHGEGGVRDSFHTLATAVITCLISGRFAKSTGLEEQVWTTESQLRIHKSIRESTDPEHNTDLEIPLDERRLA